VEEFRKLLSSFLQDPSKQEEIVVHAITHKAEAKKLSHLIVDMLEGPNIGSNEVRKKILDVIHSLFCNERSYRESFSPLLFKIFYRTKEHIPSLLARCLDTWGKKDLITGKTLRNLKKNFPGIQDQLQALSSKRHTSAGYAQSSNRNASSNRKRVLSESERKQLKKIEDDRRRFKNEKIQAYLISENESEDAQFERLYKEIMQPEEFDFWGIMLNSFGYKWKPQFSVTPKQMEECEERYKKEKFFQPVRSSTGRPSKSRKKT